MSAIAELLSVDVGVVLQEYAVASKHNLWLVLISGATSSPRCQASSHATSNHGVGICSCVVMRFGFIFALSAGVVETYFAPMCPTIYVWCEFLLLVAMFIILFACCRYRSGFVGCAVGK